MLPEDAPSRVLELGAGTGQLTRLLAERWPSARIDALDVTEEMVKQSISVFEARTQINWIVDDAQTFRGDAPYDLVASSAALHWTPDIAAALKNSHANLKPGGRFALGLMLYGTLWELREIRRRVAPGKMVGEGLPTEAFVTEILHEAGFQIERQQSHERRHIYAGARDFLLGLHEQGITGLQDGERLLNRSELSALLRLYEERYATVGGVYATYVTAVFLLKKT